MMQAAAKTVILVNGWKNDFATFNFSLIVAVKKKFSLIVCLVPI